MDSRDVNVGAKTIVKKRMKLKKTTSQTMSLMQILSCKTFINELLIVKRDHGLLK